MPHFETLSKIQLHELADKLLNSDPAAIEQCVAFLQSETWGNWHNRARALMARRLKHCTLSVDQQNRLVTTILERLVAGRFAAQFKDQLRLALRLDVQRCLAAARSCQHHPKDYVHRYAAWVLSHEQPRRAR